MYSFSETLQAFIKSDTMEGTCMYALAQPLCYPLENPLDEAVKESVSQSDASHVQWWSLRKLMHTCADVVFVTEICLYMNCHSADISSYLTYQRPKLPTLVSYFRFHSVRDFTESTVHITPAKKIQTSATSLALL